MVQKAKARSGGKSAKSGKSYRDPFKGRSNTKDKPKAGTGWRIQLIRIIAISWLFIFIAYESGIFTSWAFALFLGVLAAAAAGTVMVAVEVAKGKEALRAARAVTIIALALIIPILFDPHTHEAFDLPKFTVLVIGALMIASLEAVEAIYTWRLPKWRSGLLILISVWIASGILSTLTSIDVHLSLLGYRSSYDGLYATLAFAVIALGTAEAFDPADIQKLIGVLGIAAGSVVAIYGLIQLHDFTLHGTPWDFVHWQSGAPNVFSTLGNPNDLGGYIAMIFPVCLIAAKCSKNKDVRRGLYLLSAAMMIILLQSGARGAWVALLAGGVVLIYGTWPEIRRRPLIPAGVVCAVLGGMALVTTEGSHFIGKKFSRLLASGGTVRGRLDLWDASLHIGAAHPLAGTGLSTFVYVFPRYETPAWARQIGFAYTANGAHDIFMNVLADRGFTGLIIIIAIIIYAALLSWKGYRSLRDTEATGSPLRDSHDDELSGSAIDPPRKQRPQEAGSHKNGRLEKTDAALAVANTRLTLVAVAAALAAFLVQDMFNTEQIALAFSWWLLLGCLVTLAPPLRNPIRHHAKANADDDCKASPWRKYPKRYTAGVAAGVVLIAVAAFLSYAATAPWRADSAYWAATDIQYVYPKLAKSLTRSEAGTTQLVALSQSYFSDINRAIALNPWAGTYPAAAGVDLAAAGVTGNHAGTGIKTAIHDLTQARSYMERAVHTVPIASQYRYELAEILVNLARLEPGRSYILLRDARTAERAAVYWTPHNYAYSRYLATIQKLLKVQKR